MFEEYKWLETYQPENEKDLRDIIWDLDRQAENLSYDIMEDESYSKSEKEALRREYNYINDLISMLCSRRNKLFGNK